MCKKAFLTAQLSTELDISNDERMKHSTTEFKLYNTQATLPHMQLNTLEAC